MAGQRRAKVINSRGAEVATEDERLANSHDAEYENAVSTMYQFSGKPGPAAALSARFSSRILI